MKSFLQLNLEQNHNKNEYSIKKNKIRLLRNKKEISFDSITYEADSTNEKLLFEFLNTIENSKKKQAALNSAQQSKNSKSRFSKSNEQQTLIQQQITALTENIEEATVPNLTILFNYEVSNKVLESLFVGLMDIKKFQKSSFKIGHFELRNNHISDYNKTRVRTGSYADEMDEFSKEIDTCIKFDKAWRIRQSLSLKSFTRENYKSKDIFNRNSRTNYEKKTNEFFVCEIDGASQLQVIILPRQKDYVLTKAEEKEIEQTLVLQKGWQDDQAEIGHRKGGKVNVEFNTALGQIFQSYIVDSDSFVLVSQFPAKNGRSFEQVLRIPEMIGENCQQEVQKIVSAYNKEKEDKLSIEMSKMKVKLRELRYKKKAASDNISFIMAKYKKGFSNVTESIVYLNDNNITDISSFKNSIEAEIREKAEEIDQELEELKSINEEIITAGERNSYFKEKMEELKENLQMDLRRIDSNIPTKFKTAENDEDSLLNKSGLEERALQKILEIEEENIYTVQLTRELEQYQNELRSKVREKLQGSEEKTEFHELMEEVRGKTSKMEFMKLEQKFLELISQI